MRYAKADPAATLPMAEWAPAANYPFAMPAAVKPVMGRATEAVFFMVTCPLRKVIFLYLGL